MAGFNSPLTPAVKGTLAFLRKRAAAPAARASAMVLVTEARPGLRPCVPGDPLAAIPDLEAAAKGPPAIPTYVIGLVGQDAEATSRENLDRLAAAGGTGTPFVLDQAADAVAKFQAAMNKIRSAALPCELAVPARPPGELDFKKVNVTLVGSSSRSELGYAGSAAGCHPMRGGWYYDGDPASGATPKKILLCPASCQSLKGDEKARAELLFGCATRLIE